MADNSVTPPLIASTYTNVSAVERLQAQNNTPRQPVNMTQPGYKIFFYSRFAPKNSGLDVTSNLDEQHDYTKIPTINTVTPTLTLNSESLGVLAASQPGFNRDSNPYISSISAHQVIDDVRGSIAAVEIIQPEGVEYFKPTIGSQDIIKKNYPDIDYHNPNLPNDGPIHIGAMDTVLIKLANTSNYGMPNSSTSFTGATYVEETVFRGVISQIYRKKSANGGSLITLQLMDFSEFLRQLNALPNGILSTVFFGLTGRSLVNTLLTYSNEVFIGNKNFLKFNKNYYNTYASNIANTTLDNAIQQIANSQPAATNAINSFIQTGAGDIRANPQHRMSNAPFFWLEYTAVDSPTSNKIPGAIPDSQFGQLLTQDPHSTIATLITQAKDGILDLYKNVTQILGKLANGNFKGFLTPEDIESSSIYEAFGTGASLPQGVTKLLTKLNIPLTIPINQIAWILTDLYLEKGLVTFEQKQIWNLIYQTADRSMREVYFDFSPKLRLAQSLNSDPVYCFDSAPVPDVLANPDLPDIHPNIGILKYRLSPCFVPFPVSAASQSSTTNDKGHTVPPKGQKTAKREDFQFRTFEINDDVIINTNASESEDHVYTAVFGFGGDDGNSSIQDIVKSAVSGASNGLIAYAHTLDSRIEYRLGFRFMTDHDEKIQIPFLMYLTSYALLHKSQANMFQQTLEVVGNPYYQPGSIVKVVSQNADYYCTQVLHKWSLADGYTCELQLHYGHTTGRFPTMISGSYDELGDSTSVDDGCSLRQNTLIAGGLQTSTETIIGGISLGCLVSALWEYMTCSATTPEALKMATKNYEKSHLRHASGEWIKLSSQAANIHSITTTNGQGYLSGPNPNIPIAQFMNVINTSLSKYGLANYNVTPNTMLNIMAQESKGYCNSVSPDGGYGLWQLTGQQPSATNPGGISNQDACFQQQLACDHACATLLSAMKANNVIPGKTGQGSAWLAGLSAYNSGSSSIGDPQSQYVNDVLGPQQVKDIFNNTQNPDNAKPGAVLSGLACQEQTADLKTWPVDVYGPIGMQLSSASKVGFKGSSDDYRNLLLAQGNYTFQQAMKYSLQYIQNFLTKYKGGTQFNPTGTSYPINQNDLISKVLAAWFTDDGTLAANKTDLALLNNTITNVTRLYQGCKTCQMANESTYDNKPYASIAADQQDRQDLVSKLYFRSQSDKDDILTMANPNSTSNTAPGTDANLIRNLTALVRGGGHKIWVGYVRQDHPTTDGGVTGQGHNAGCCIDCWPLIDSYPDSLRGTVVGRPDDSQFVSTSGLTKFCSDAARGPYAYQVLLGGTAKTYLNDIQSAVNSANPSVQCFGENTTADHIHIGVHKSQFVTQGNGGSPNG